MSNWKAVQQKYALILVIVFLLVVAVIVVAPSETGYLSFGKSSFWESGKASKSTAKIGPPPIDPIPPKTITVCKSGSCNAKNVVEAHNLAANGDTIKITDKGIYTESLSWGHTDIDKRITLNCDGATIGGNPNNPANTFIGISIIANSVIVQNCNIVGNVGISSSNIVFQNNKIMGRNIFHNIQISGSATAPAKNNQIRGNTIDTPWVGIWLNQFVENNVIEDNTILTTSDSGLRVGSPPVAGRAFVKNNIVSRNTITAGSKGLLSGIQILGLDVMGNKIIGNTVIGASSGIRIEAGNPGQKISGQNFIENNKISKSVEAGIKLVDAENQIVKGNTLNGLSSSIILLSSSNNEISQNTLREGGSISLYAKSTGNIFRGNNVYGAFLWGFFGDGTQNAQNVIDGNSFCSSKSIDIDCSTVSVSGRDNLADKVKSCSSLINTRSCKGSGGGGGGGCIEGKDCPVIQ